MDWGIEGENSKFCKIFSLVPNRRDRFGIMVSSAAILRNYLNRHRKAFSKLVELSRDGEGGPGHDFLVSGLFLILSLKLFFR